MPRLSIVHALLSITSRFDRAGSMLAIPSQRRHHCPEPRSALILKSAHVLMVGRNPRPFGIIQDWRRAGLVNDVILGVFQIRPLLLPEEEHVESTDERRELVGDVL